MVTAAFNMAMKLLLTNLAVSPDAKFLLVRVVRTCGFGVVDMPVVELQALADMTDAVLKRSREELLARGHISAVVPPRAGIDGGTHHGRPRAAFMVSTLLKQAMDSTTTLASQAAPAIPGACFSAVESVLFAPEFSIGVPKANKRRSASATPATRLVLAVLLALADEGGVVRGYGRGEIGRFCGMTAQRLDGQLARLRDAGMVRTIVSGVTGRSAYGRAPGAIFLNVAHPAFGSGANEAVVCVNDNFMLGPVDFLTAQEVYARAQSANVNDWQKMEALITPRPFDSDELDALTDLIKRLIRSSTAERIAKVDEGLLLDVQSGPYSQTYDFWLRGVWNRYGLKSAFQDATNTRVDRYLQLLIERLASRLLGADWGILSGQRVPDLPYFEQIGGGVMGTVKTLASNTGKHVVAVASVVPVDTAVIDVADHSVAASESDSQKGGDTVGVSAVAFNQGLGMLVFLLALRMALRVQVIARAVLVRRGQSSDKPSWSAITILPLHAFRSAIGTARYAFSILNPSVAMQGPGRVVTVVRAGSPDRTKLDVTIGDADAVVLSDFVP